MPSCGDLEALIEVEACFDALRQAQGCGDSGCGSPSRAATVCSASTKKGSDEVRFKIVAMGGTSMPPEPRRQLLERVLREDP